MSKELENKIEACLARGIRAELSGMLEIPRDVCEEVLKALVKHEDDEEVAEALARFEDAMDESGATEP